MGVNRDKTQKSFLTLNFSNLIDSFVVFSIQVEEVDCMCENDGFAHVIPEIWSSGYQNQNFLQWFQKKDVVRTLSLPVDPLEEMSWKCTGTWPNVSYKCG